jgi:MoCo/4Fe-4S cofactor protein with predicted Tat translocation signal
MPRRDYQSKSGSETWRSRQELAGSEEFHRHLEAEFLAEFAAPGDGLSRRRFLQLMSASIAMATLAGCRWPEEKIVPFVQRPEDTTPGTTKRFATTLELAGAASGVLVTSFDGRPIKIEGNPNHPFSLGAADVFAQASILELYDPDRSQSVIRREGHQTVRATWDDFAQFAREQLALLNRGQGLAVLSEASDSPSVAATSRRFAERFPGAQCFTYEPIKRDIIARGVPYPYRQHLDLTAARIIVDLNADLLGRHPTALRNAHQFAAGRAPSETMNRLYAFEPSLSVTGAAADHRYRRAGGGIDRAPSPRRGRADANLRAPARPPPLR